MKKEIKYRIKSLVEDKFFFNYDFDYGSADLSRINFRISQSTKTEMEKGEVVIKAIVEIRHDEDVTLVENSVLLTFLLSPIKEVLVPKEDGVSTTEPAIMDTFFITAFGALRGVLAKNLRGTPLEDFILPLIPVDTFKVINKN